MLKPIKLEVLVHSPSAIKGTRFEVEGITVDEAFKKIPMEAAARGYGLTTYGNIIKYTVRIIS